MFSTLGISPETKICLACLRSLHLSLFIVNLSGFLINFIPFFPLCLKFVLFSWFPVAYLFFFSLQPPPSPPISLCVFPSHVLIFHSYCPFLLSRDLIFLSSSICTSLFYRSSPLCPPGLNFRLFPCLFHFLFDIISSLSLVMSLRRLLSSKSSHSLRILFESSSLILT